ncbi:hypothetical protein [Fortiea contorta]|uniref:hypothetical protein n=1 Tax=Fortiea contorta TaxID=1892405 RepID=UPI00034D5B98|nr:hypothetical protein [Fortiea contorta]
MDFEGKVTDSTTTSRQPLVLLRDTEAALRRATVTALVPILPAKLSKRVEATSVLAENSLNELAEISLEQVSDLDLRPARIQVGLSCVGFGALMIVVLLLYLNTLHPELSPMAQIRQYWYQYVWFVNLGVTGLFLLGREAMRPLPKRAKLNRDKVL